MLGEQDKLYVFMNFMKSRNAIHVLQVYLTLGVCVRACVCGEEGGVLALSAGKQF